MREALRGFQPAPTKSFVIDSGIIFAPPHHSTESGVAPEEENLSSTLTVSPVTQTIQNAKNAAPDCFCSKIGRR